jgi:hypothetical protein
VDQGSRRAGGPAVDFTNSWASLRSTDAGDGVLLRPELGAVRRSRRETARVR